MKYRSEIDGLRALAVFPVVFFHAGFDLFSGGFVGVDVFFVISGYLITSIILKELNNDSFSLAYFYERRARRILPTLYLVILVSTLLSFIFLTRSELGGYFKSVIATLLFFSNFYFWRTTPYFQSESELEPLLHTWSLSIEEQFYIIFPLLLIFLYKFFKKSILFILSLSFFGSIIVCQFLAIETSGTLNFYFTLSRVWELALGGITAYFLQKKTIKLNSNLNNFLSLAGLLLVLFAIFFFNKKTIYPSLYTLIPTIGTVLIILFAEKNSYVKKILSIKILVSIGLISYSLYLWHQPLLVFGRVYFNNFSEQHKILIIIISLFLSYLSYNFCEKLFRDKKTISLKFLIKISTIIFLILLIFSKLNINFFSSVSINGTEAQLAKLLSRNQSVYSVKMDERQFVKFRIIYENLNPKTLIVGSSRIMQISNSIYDNGVLNLGVSGASIEDQIAITEMALSKFKPKKLILSADPWLFNKHNAQTRWKSLSEEFNLSLENIRSLKNKNNFININLIEVKKNFYEKVLENYYNFLNIRKLNVQFLRGTNIQKEIILKDGTRVYSKKNQAEEIKGIVANYSMDPYQFSDKNFELYSQFINYLRKVRNIEVVLILTPYHPDTYDLTIKAKPFYIELENKFKDIVKKNKVQIIGSYDPSLVKCEKNEFYDYHHPMGSCMKKIIKNIN